MFRLLIIVMLLSGCASHKMTGYNVKTTVGQTEEEGKRSLYTGCSIDMHVDIK